MNQDRKQIETLIRIIRAGLPPTDKPHVVVPKPPLGTRKTK